ncbi:MAG TPA: FtsX-like permease family protein [Elusimicrobiales bacterium]|nr:FtsX-like permease family protein [Elusimicrobiales bacterium]
MKLILTIAWRNILRHKGKSLVIGAILFTGAFLMTLGNGVITGMAAGVETNIVNGFMGDIVLVSDAQKSDNILLPIMGATIETISTYPKIKEILAAQPYVRHSLPVGKNLAMMLDENTTTPGFAYLIGVDFAEYRKMFPDNFRVIEGSYPVTGQRAMLFPDFARGEFYNFYNIWFLPEGGAVVKEHLSKEALAQADTLPVSTTVVMLGLTSGLNSTNDIRFPIKGIVQYKALNKIFGHFCLVDIESYRECLGYFTAADMAAQVPGEEKKLLALEGSDLDSLFGGEDMMTTGAAQKKPRAVAAKKKAQTAEEGVYNAVFVKLNPGVTYKDALKDLNRALSDAKTGVHAVAWNKASGPIGSMALIIKAALFLFVTLLFCVAVIIIVNTLTMAALERTAEIGMMRAIGARKAFIAGMFLGETAMLSAVFGGAGIIAGIIAVRVIPVLRITTDNDILQILYGGNFFNPLLSLSGIALTAAQLLAVTIVAALYPMRVAGEITPLDAVTRD